MKSTWVWSLLSLVAIQSVVALPDPAPVGNRLVKREDEEEEIDAETVPTTFNGVEVPAKKLLTGENFEESIKDGYWFVKHHSPYCPHCLAVAPTWQTLYEFYYTSNPLGSSSSKPNTDKKISLNSFTGYYDFHFASMDCVASADKCKALGVAAWPTFILYHNGQMVEKFTGTKSMDGLSAFVEEKLEKIKPGSRSPSGLKLPEPGDKGIDTTAQPDVPAGKDKDPGAGVKAGEKHNEQIAGLATLAGDSTSEPNPQGTSIPFTAESFQRLVTTTRDPWFIKFYAPWCSHCKALAPNWAQMAKDMKGTLNVGEVNCEAEARLCKDARVSAYPTMYYFRGGERVEYDGLRGLGDLVSYAKKAVQIGSGVPDVDAVTFKEMEETEEVIFLYFYDHATTSEDFAALERLTLSLVGHARLVKTNSKALAERFKISTWPRLLVSRDGRPSYYNALAPRDMRDFRQILNWMQSNWLPIVPELTPMNAREIMDNKFVVLGILNPKRSDEFIQDKRELKNAALEWMDKQTQLFQLERQELRDAKQLRIEEAEDRNDQRALRAAKSRQITIREDDKKQVGFAWVDGVFWDRWVRTTYGIDVNNGERVVINDQDNRRYWDASETGNYIMVSRTSILETLPSIIANPPKLSSKSTVGTLESMFFHSRSFTVNHPILFAILLLIAFGATYIMARGRLRRGRFPGGILGASGAAGSSFFHLDGKEGLLNGGGNGGKVD